MSSYSRHQITARYLSALEKLRKLSQVCPDIIQICEALNRIHRTKEIQPGSFISLSAETTNHEITRTGEDKKSTDRYNIRAYGLKTSAADQMKYLDLLRENYNKEK